MLLNKASVDSIFKSTNPSLFNLNDLGTASGIYDSEGNFVFPQPMRLTRGALTGVNWCLLDDGFCLFLYILKLV